LLANQTSHDRIVDSGATKHICISLQWFFHTAIVLSLFPQDSHSRRIGTAKHRDGLYYMSLSAPATAGNVVSTFRHLELLHLDIWGPYSVNSIHNHRYFLAIVDDHN
jgi:hypothetical protein